MHRHPIKKILCLFIAVLLLSVNSSAALAAGDNNWVSTTVEQACTFVPQMDIFLYPKSIDGALLLGLTKEAADLEVYLGEEKFEVDSLESAENVPTSYYVLLNVADNNINYDYLRSIKEGLCSWIDHLSEQDRFILMSFDEDYRLVLDGSESRDAAKTLISNISSAYKNSETVHAIEKLIELAQATDKAITPRRVMVLFDNGTFLTEETSTVINTLQDSMIRSSLPLYAVSSYRHHNVPQLMSDFTAPTGGRAFDCSDSTYKDAVVDDVRIWIDSCYLLKTHGSSNEPLPEERELTINCAGSANMHKASFAVKIDGHIKDEQLPYLLSFSSENEGRELHIKYSEPVSGADNMDAFSVTVQGSDERVSIKSIQYLEQECETVIELDEELKDGEYVLTITKPETIKDSSYDGNVLQLNDGDSYEFVVGEGSPDLNKTYAIIIASAVVFLIAVIVIIFTVVAKKRKAQFQQEMFKTEEEKRRIEEEKRRIEEEKRRAEEESKRLIITLSIITPDGSKFVEKITLKNHHKFAIGRNDDMSDLAIPGDESISRKHLELEYSNKKLVVYDAGSKNGTFVNNKRISGQYQLVNKDVITIGESNITINY